MKDTICSLIKDDINHSMLMKQLDLAGFDTLRHTLNLSDSILALLGLNDIPSIDEVSSGYFDLVRKYNESEGTNLDEFSRTIYSYLEGFIPHP